MDTRYLSAAQERVLFELINAAEGLDSFWLRASCGPQWRSITNALVNKGLARKYDGRWHATKAGRTFGLEIEGSVGFTLGEIDKPAVIEPVPGCFELNPDTVAASEADVLGACRVCGAAEFTYEDARFVHKRVADVRGGGSVAICFSCSARHQGVHGLLELELVIANAIALRRERLRFEELAYLRQHLRFSVGGLAEYIDVPRKVVESWDTHSRPKEIPLAAEKLLRMMVILDRVDVIKRLERAGRVARARKPLWFRRTHERWTRTYR